MPFLIPINLSCAESIQGDYTIINPLCVDNSLEIKFHL